MKKIEYSKKLLIADYLILIILFLFTASLPEVDFITLDVAWIAQIAVSSGFYFWKAKNENRVKIPMKVIKSLPKEVRDNVDLTQGIVSLKQAG